MGRRGGLDRPGRLLLKFFLVLLAGRALAVDLWRHGRKRKPCGRHAHYLLRDAVSLMLQRIVNGADMELRLNGDGEAQRKNSRRLNRSGRQVRKERELADIRRGRCFPAGHLRGIVLIVMYAGLI